MRSNVRLTAPASRPCPLVRTSLDDIIGERVKATMPEMKTAPASVNANSRKRDREQREQVQREPERLDEEHRADERQGNHGNGHEDGPERAEKEEDDDH